LAESLELPSSCASPVPLGLSVSDCVHDAAASAQLYPLPLHDALPIYERRSSDIREVGQDWKVVLIGGIHTVCAHGQCTGPDEEQDRKSTRLNSSHVSISYAVFCLKKKTERRSRRIRSGSGKRGAATRR